MSQIGIAITLCIGFFIIAAQKANADEQPPKDKSPRMNKPLSLDMGLLGDDWLGDHGWKRIEPTNPPSPIRDEADFCELSYVWDGKHIQVHPLANVTKEAKDRDGWYLTGYYSMTPPRVILSKEPTKHSDWRFVPGTRSGTHYYIQNLNAPNGNDAFLVLKDIGHRARLQTSKEEVHFSDAVLDFEKKEEFRVADLEEEEGK